MCRASCRLLCALSTFTVGLLLCQLFPSFKPTHFACGDRFGATAYESSDGVKLTFHSSGHDSPAQALEEFRRMLSLASEVRERAPRLGKAGQVVGERAVVVFQPDGRGRKAAVIWTEGKLALAVESSSLRHALLLEKKLDGED